MCHKMNAPGHAINLTVLHVATHDESGAQSPSSYLSCEYSTIVNITKIGLMMTNCSTRRLQSFTN